MKLLNKNVIVKIQNLIQFVNTFGQKESKIKIIQHNGWNKYRNKLTNNKNSLKKESW
jgi:hypothetical protein